MSGEDDLTRLKLTAVRDQLDTLLDEAARRELSLRESLAFLCAAEVARKDERRIHMAMSIAKFPFVRTLEDFEFDAQPSLDPKQIRDLATCRWSPTATRCSCSARRASGKAILPWVSAARRSGAASRCCSCRRRRW